MANHRARPSGLGKQTDGRRSESRRRELRSFAPGLGWLEDRTLLSADLGAEASPLAFDSPHDGIVPASAADVYRVVSSVGGRLSVTLETSGVAVRVSLVDGRGVPLVQSDGPALGAGDGRIDVHVPAGNDYLKVEGLGGSGSYRITAHLTPTDPALRPVPAGFSGAAPVAVADVNGDGIADLITPEGVHFGVGDGAFRSPAVDGALLTPGWRGSALTVGDFNHDGRLDVAIAETNADDNAGQLHVFMNLGEGRLQPGSSTPISPDANAIQVLDFGGGVLDLAVANDSAGAVTIFQGDGSGGFSAGPVLDQGNQPHSLAAGRFGDGRLDLVVANSGQGLAVFQADGPGTFHLSSTIQIGSGLLAVVAGDFGNGQIGLAVADSASNLVSVFLGRGNGTFEGPRSYLVGSAPTALIAGAFGGDGHDDLATANASSNDVSVLLAKGQGDFAPQLRFGVGESPEALATGDLNGDGRLDLTVGNLGSSDVTLLLGRGGGSFEGSATNAVGNGPSGAVSADLNRDGHIDLVTANFASNDVSVLLGNGDGGFQPARSFAAGVGPSAVVVGDFNGDGRLDLAAASRTSQGVSILLGNGDGTFQAPVPDAAGADPQALVAGDFNGDGVLDLAVANFTSNDVSILLGDGHGDFRSLPAVPLGGAVGGPSSIVAGDFGNGVLDLAVAGEGGNAVSILMGDGLGGFRALDPIPLGNDQNVFTNTLAVGDFNGDGAADLAVATGYIDGAPDTVTILSGRGGGKFNILPPVALGSGLYPTAITTVSLVDGGPPGLAIVDSSVGTVSLLEGNGLGGFSLLPALGLGGQSGLTFVTTGDFNGDGRPDLAAARSLPSGVTIELNRGSGRFVEPGAVGLSPRETPLIADLNGDGAADVTIVNGAGDIFFRSGQVGNPGAFDAPITVNPGAPARDVAQVVTSEGVLLASVDSRDDAVSLFAFRNGRFVRVGSLPTGQGPAQIVAGDFNGDGHTDLVVRNSGDGTLSVFPGDGRGGFGAARVIAAGLGIADVSVADVNQDGVPDLLLADSSSGAVDVLLNRGGLGFDSPVLYRAGTGLSAVVATASRVISNDGTSAVAAGALVTGGPPALVTLNAGAETLGVLSALGAGRFANPSTLPTTGPTSAVRIADLNGDGNADLAVLGPNGLTIWLGDGQGHFVEGSTIDVGPNPNGLSVADLNGDGLPDLIVGNAFGDVLVLLGAGHGTFRPPTSADQGMAVSMAGFSPNGAPFFVVSNQALDRISIRSSLPGNVTVLGDRTTGLLAPGAPVTADLNGDGIPDLIVPNGGGNNVLVFPGLPGGKFGPPLNGNRGFPTGTNPSAVAVADVNGDGLPDLLVANKGSNDVTILLNERLGNGNTFVNGPRLRVGSGPVALAYADGNRGGFAGIVVADAGSKDVRLLPSLGGGFFNDANPTVFALKESPGPIFLGPFTGGSSSIVTLNPGTGHVTLISGLATASPLTRVFSSGGFDPISAIAVTGANGFADLLVANRENGNLSLLQGGPLGLILDKDSQVTGLPSPSAAALLAVQNDSMTVYVVSPGEEAAILLSFGLSAGSSVVSGNGGGSGGFPPTAGVQGFTLLPLRDSSLPLIATLLTPPVDLDAASASSAPEASTAASIASTATSVGQGPLANPSADDDLGDDGLSEVEAEPTAENDPVDPPSPWLREVFGLDDAFEDFRRSTHFTLPLDAALPLDVRLLPASPVPTVETAAADPLSAEDFSPSPPLPPVADSLADPPPGPGPIVSLACSALLTGLILTPAGPSGRFWRRIRRADRCEW